MSYRLEGAIVTTTNREYRTWTSRHVGRQRRRGISSAMSSATAALAAASAATAGQWQTPLS